MEVIVSVFQRKPTTSSLKAKVEQGIPALKEKLKLICGTNAVTEEYFIKVLPSKNPEFPRRFFQILSKGKPSLDQVKLIKRIVKLANNKDHVKLKVLFDIYDFNGDGSLSFDEVGLLLRACMAENGLQFTEDEIRQLTTTFIEEADKDNSNTVDFDEFKSLMDRYDSLIECMCRSFERWMLLCPAQSTKNNTKKLSFWQVEYIINNKPNVIAVIVYVIFSVGLFFGRVGYFAAQHAHPFVLIARGAGMLLNLNCSLMMVFVLRRTITRLRIWGLANYLPLDKNIKYHKYVGYVIAFFSVVHTLAHLGNYANLAAIKGQPFKYIIISPHPELFTFFFGAANITGWICLTALLIIVVSSLPFVRKSGHFEIFAVFHLFYIVFWFILLCHGPKFWCWLVVPGSIFLFEKLYNFINIMGASGHSYVVRGRVLPSKVSHIAIRRPPNFNYQPGDWVYVQIPYIARWEWHPFTISSAPEMPDVIFLHIRSAGQWTNRLHQILLDQEAAYECPRKRTSVKSPEYALTMPSTPTVINSPISLSSNEISETPFIIRRAKAPFQTNETIKYGQVLQDLANRLGSICAENSKDRVVQFTRPIGRCCDDDEACFYSFKDRNQIDILNTSLNDEKGSTERITNSTPKTSRTTSLNKMGKSYAAGPFKGSIIKSPLELIVRLDGPYGAPASHFFQTEHAVLVATGIGVTPFASILQSIMFRYAKSQHLCPQCNYSWSDAVPIDMMKLKKVDFIWLNRDQKSLEWFVHLLSQLEMTQAQIDPNNRFLDIHIFITAALDSADIRAIGLHLALGLMHEKKDRDLVSGLKTRAKPGRPVWAEVFNDIKRQKKGKVSLFFCGSPVLSKELHSLCNQYGFNFHKENF
ncbi:NADPH oxidase 5 isoform X2 [Tetranychus urticae]|uniref:NADPH oxidase 5 isoform X2 n=1 Tax=Tetranychus urticae TaxID=32264 RepID=UPI00077BDE9D|nr:NADPH oxidase 5 isoform X2 [Tetranychus urticae]